VIVEDPVSNALAVTEALLDWWNCRCRGVWPVTAMAANSFEVNREVG